MRFGLREDIIDRINSVFEKYPQVETAVLYGSRAKGNFRNGSDIDLTLTGENLEHGHLLKIMTDIDDLLLPWSFDLSVRKHIGNPALLSHIDRVGVVFYERK